MTLDSWTLRSSEVPIQKSLSAPISDYVSAKGEVRAQTGCKAGTSSLTTSTDVLAIAYATP